MGSNTMSNFQIDDQWLVTADCSDDSGYIHTRSFSFKDYVGCDSSGTLLGAYTKENVTEFWNESWPLPTITPEGRLTWTHPSGNVSMSTEADMTDYIQNKSGHFNLDDVNVTVLVLIEYEGIFLEQLRALLTKAVLDEDDPPVFEFTTHPTQDGVTLFYAKASAEPEGQIFKSFTVEARVALVNIGTDTGVELTEIDFDIFAARTGVQFGSYNGADASANLVAGRVSLFDAKLGFGVSTGVGIRDEAVEVNFLGCGFTIGKRIGISVFDNSFEINFGRFF